MGTFLLSYDLLRQVFPYQKRVSCSILSSCLQTLPTPCPVAFSEAVMFHLPQQRSGQPASARSCSPALVCPERSRELRSYCERTARGAGPQLPEKLYSSTRGKKSETLQTEIPLCYGSMQQPMRAAAWNITPPIRELNLPSCTNLGVANSKAGMLRKGQVFPLPLASAVKMKF